MNKACEYPPHVWLINNLPRIRALKSPSIYVKGTEFRLILERIFYLNPTSDFFEIHLQEIQSQRRHLTNFLVRVHIRDIFGYEHFFQKSEFNRRQFVSSHRVWKARCLDLFRILEWGDEMFIICDIRPDSKCQVGFSQESNLRNDEIPCCKSLKSLSSDFSCMLRNGTGTDVVIKCGKEAQFIYAHKTVLATRSPVFSKIFQTHTGSACTRTILEIGEIDSVTFEHFLEFIYSGRISEKDIDSDCNLYMVAHKYQVLTLKEECAKAIMRKMTIDSAYEMLFLAEEYEDEMLKCSVIDFLLGKSILETDSWFSFTEMYPDLSIVVYFSFFVEVADRYLLLPVFTDIEIAMESVRDKLQ